MKSCGIVLMLAAGIVGGAPGAGGIARSDADTIEAHVAAARAAAGKNYVELLGLCDAPDPAPPPTRAPSPHSRPPDPPRSGNDSVKRYLTVADECAQAGLLRLE